MARLKTGCPASFEQIVRTHTAGLLAVTRRLLGNEEDARDAVQEAFLNAYRSISTFHAGCALGTWLHRIAINSALMRLRSRKKRHETSISELLPRFTEDGHHVDPPGKWQDRSDQPVLLEEDRALVRKAIDRLPDTFRTVLLLRDIEELDTARTAELLGISANAVKIRLHRARQALRSLLEPHFRQEVTV